MIGCGTNSSNKINATESTNQPIWTALIRYSPDHKNIGFSSGAIFIISMTARLDARIDDADAIQSFFLPVLGLNGARLCSLKQPRRRRRACVVC
jgi:hypothetical protein